MRKYRVKFAALYARISICLHHLLFVRGHEMFRVGVIGGHDVVRDFVGNRGSPSSQSRRHFHDSPQIRTRPQIDKRGRSVRVFPRVAGLTTISTTISCLARIFLGRFSRRQFFFAKVIAQVGWGTSLTNAKRYARILDVRRRVRNRDRQSKSKVTFADLHNGVDKVRSHSVKMANRSDPLRSRCLRNENVT